MGKLLLVMLGLVLIVSAACKSKTDSIESGEILIEDRCLRCHQAGISTSGRTAAEWDELVTRMISKGTILNSQEKAVLVEYLSRTYKK